MIPGSASPFFLGASKATGGGAAGYQIERSLRFNSSDSGFLSRTPAVAGDRRTWTWAGWVKRSKLGEDNYALFGVASTFIVRFTNDDGGDGIRFYNASPACNLITSFKFRDPSAWYHIVIALDTTQATSTNRLKIYVNGVQFTNFSTSSYPAQNDQLGWNSTTAHGLGSQSDSGAGPFNGYLADIHFIDGQALTPSSFTEVSATTGQLIPKAYTGSYGTNGFHLPFSDNSSAAALGTDSSGNGNTWTVNNLSVTQGNGAWLANASITAGALYSDRGLNNVFNGIVTDGNPNSAPFNCLEFQTRPGTITFSSLIAATSTLKLWLASYNGGSKTVTLNGSTSQTFTSVPGNGVSAISYTLSVTSLSSITIPDASGDLRIFGIEKDGVLLIDNGASIAAGNDSLVDTPTSYGTDTGVGGEVRGNYATLNPLVITSATTLANGNLDVTSSGQLNAVSTIVPSSDKWYLEITLGSIVTNSFIGLYGTTPLNSSYCVYGINGYGFLNTGWGSASSTVSGTGVAGDVIGLALDVDARTLQYYKNGASIGTISNFTFVQNWSIGISCNATVSTPWVFNFGQRPFAYTAPAGFKALCDTNLPAPLVALPNTVMDVKLYTGNGAANTITGLAFSPDLVWIKARSASGYWHELFDVVRGVSRRLFSNDTAAEDFRSGQGLTAFNADGFSLTYVDGNDNGNNGNGLSFVAWTWDAGTSTVSNTAGSITSQVRANASAGFSIQTWTASGTGSDSWGHGLGITPEFVIVKRRSSAQDWYVWHKSITSSQYLILNSTGAVQSYTNIWGSTGPSSSLVYFSASPGDHVSYCFAPVAGYSSFGSYTGNGSADGPFVFCNFRPKYVLLKCSSAGDSAKDWFVHDGVRDTYNLAQKSLNPNRNIAELDNASYGIDLLSNGFKIRTTSTGWNGSAETYIYAAFAENPFQYARAR